jgi:ribosomal protein S12 methylthiotransferase
LLKEADFPITFEIEKAEIAFLNTCCFIKEAKEEAIDYIFELVRLKENKQISKIVILGCLSKRYGKQLKKEIPEIDAIISFDNYPKISEAVSQILKDKKVFWVSNKAPEYIYYEKTLPRIRLTPKHISYVKISEGCCHSCSFCAIANIKGFYRSRPMESILKQINQLTKEGAKEIVLIGQDTSSYGIDLYGRPSLSKLLDEIVNIPDLKWLRILYTHPAYIDDALLERIKSYDIICNYIDLPLQHISKKILTSMKRTPSKQKIYKLLEKIRDKIPGVAIRSSLIVGFPGETEEDFKELEDFIKKIKFERLGVFRYSKEENTPAYNYKNQIDEKTKQKRFDKIMALQQKIAAEVNNRLQGKTIEVMIDEKDPKDKNLYLARTRYDAPEVDGLVYLRSESGKLKPGDIVTAKISDTYEYDLVAEMV